MLTNLRQTPYDPMKDFVPVARVGDLVCGFVIHPSVGAKTFAEMLDYAKKNPGKLNYGSAGLGTGAHLRIEMLKYKTGVDIAHIPYRGSADALNDLLPGNVQMMNEINVLPHVKAGKLILLNINYPTRSPEWPDTPTLTELGVKDADEPIWYSSSRRPGRRSRSSTSSTPNASRSPRPTTCRSACGTSASSCLSNAGGNDCLHEEGPRQQWRALQSRQRQAGVTFHARRLSSRSRRMRA